MQGGAETRLVIGSRSPAPRVALPLAHVRRGMLAEAGGKAV